MKTGVFLPLVLSLPFAMRAADKVEPLNIRVGLWEVTTTVTASGEMPIPAVLLDKLTPEQRARVEERMNARKSDPARTTIAKKCLTRQQLIHGIPFRPDRKSCTWTVFTSTRSQLEMRAECFDESSRSNGMVQIDALDSESVKGSVQFSSTSGNRVTSWSTFTARWIAPLCSSRRKPK
jgi:hypothetical protein